MAVRTKNDEVLDQRRVEVHRSVNEIVDAHVAVRHLETNSAWLPRVLARVDFRFRQTETRALVLVFRIAFALRLQLLRTAVAVVRATAGDELLGSGEILRLPLRLEVRRMRTGDHRPFVPVQAEPAQTVENARDH